MEFCFEFLATQNKIKFNWCIEMNKYAISHKKYVKEVRY